MKRGTSGEYAIDRAEIVADMLQVMNLPMINRNVTSIIEYSGAGLTKGEALVSGAGGVRFRMNGLGGSSMTATANGTNASGFAASNLSGGYGGFTKIDIMSADAGGDTQVVKGVVPAQYGGLSGNVSFITKSGTNDWQGTLFHRYEGSALSARQPFLTTKPHSVWNQFGGTHNFSVDCLYQAPSPFKNSPIAQQFLGGWNIGGIWRARTGLPLGVTQTGGRPDLVDFKNGLNTECCSYGHIQYLNPAAFSLVTVPTASGRTSRRGSAGATALRGPGIWNVDLSLGKNFKVQESTQFEFRCDSTPIAFAVLMGVRPYGKIQKQEKHFASRISQRNRRCACCRGSTKRRSTESRKYSCNRRRTSNNHTCNSERHGTPYRSGGSLDVG
jgi:hypothetical protein